MWNAAQIRRYDGILMGFVWYLGKKNYLSKHGQYVLKIW